MNPCWFVVGALFLLPMSGEAVARNILMVVTDDLGTDLGCYGNTEVRTPHLDRLAGEGTRFTRAFCTTASCSASRSVILSGLHNHATGQYGHQHSYHNFHTFESIQTLPVLLTKAGYRTARIGKFHVQPETVYRFDEVLDRAPAGKPVNARNMAAMAERARPFLSRDDPRPFFLYFCTTDPHRSGTVNTNRPHRPDRFGNGPVYAGIENVEYSPEEVTVPAFLPDTPATRAELAEYYQAVARIDQGMGRLLEVLRASGHYDDTLILFLSDNGIAFPGSKTTLYEPGMRLPLIVRSPDQSRRGGTCDGMVSWVDLAPTVLDYAGVAFDASRFHGRSFLGILDEPNPAGWNEVYASHTFHEITMYYPMRVVRTPRYKCILNLAHALPFPFASDLEESATWRSVGLEGDRFGKRAVGAFIQRPRYELYDLERDPDEVVNLAGDSRHAVVFERLQDQLRTFQEKTGDPWVVKYRYE
jgi:N-sulfoglucosamine sulfohydrolase